LSSFLRNKFRGNEGILCNLVRTLHYDMDDGEFFHEEELSQAFQEPHSVRLPFLMESRPSLRESISSLREMILCPLVKRSFCCGIGVTHIDSDDSLVSGGDNVALLRLMLPFLLSLLVLDLTG